MRKVAGALALCCVAATACSDRLAEQDIAGPKLQVTSAACLSPTAIEGSIRSLFVNAGERNAALQRFGQIQRKLGNRPPGPDSASAQQLTLNLVDYILKKYNAGRLSGGKSIPTQASVVQLLNGLLCNAGLPPVFGPGSLGPDGAAAFIYPTTPDTTVVTETQWAGVQVPAASVTVPTLVTIQRLPDFPGPLLTQLDQYPIYYEYHSTSSSFTNDVLVGICVADNVVPPDPSRLRLAHNVAPYTMGSIEILPLAQAPFLDCTDAPIAAGASRWGFDLARARGWLERGAARLLLPRPAYAFGVGGVGGTVRTFSPFGAVDTLGVITPATSIELRAPSAGTAVAPSPSVFVRTPTGRPMVGIPVTFTPQPGGGSVTGGSAVTDTSGQATVGSWTIGTAQRCSAVVVGAAATPGSGYAGAGFPPARPFTFFGCANVFP